MSPELVLIYLCASIGFTACAFALVFLFAYALAIWDTHKERNTQP
ncbi:hypothetical protein [Paenarthrobacter sp. YJN-5]|nr:hypothetical protein [Paenarthrobacter sp. YJN-5]